MELLIEKSIGFMLVSTRLGAFFAVLPVFSWQTIPPTVKAALGLWMGIFFAMNTHLPFDPAAVTALSAILLLSTEAVYGAALGIVAATLFATVRVGAGIAEQQMGLSMADVLDPLTGETTNSLSMLLEMFFILLFLAAGGHHLLLMTLAKSYEIFPLGTMPEIGTLTEGVLRAGAMMLVAGLKIAAPLLAVSLLFVVVLGIMARLLPDMNVIFISMPLRLGLGLTMLAIFLPLVVGFVREFAELMNKLIPV